MAMIVGNNNFGQYGYFEDTSPLSFNMPADYQ